MNTPRLLVVILVSVILLIAHAYFKRGFRLTFNFFLFALIAALRKEIGTFFGSEPLMLKGSPFFFPDANLPFLISFLTVIFGWMFTFYIAWTLAEGITRKFIYFKNKIFPTLLFAGVIAASISYAVETVGVNMGWWRWKFYDDRFSNFLVGDAHFFALEAWFYFTVHFLAVYFLIECSRFKKFDWKNLFFLIYFIRTWSIVFSGGSDLPRMIEEGVMFCLLIVFSFWLPLEFKLPVLNFKKNLSVFSFKLIDSLFFLVVFNLVAVLVFLSMVKLKNMQLVISILPLITLILLALPGIKPFWVFLLCLCMVISGGNVMVPAILPVALFMIFKLFERTPKVLKVQ
jgi:hypothetical protein